MPTSQDQGQDTEHLLPLPTEDGEASTSQELATEDHPTASNNGEFKTCTRLLYTSHFLSAWNSRLFEFGAYLFLAEIFPNTLLPASVYAISRAGSAAVLSPWGGRWVDNGERLKVVRVSIGKHCHYCCEELCEFIF
jgi:solute carrier family 40 (iron-regulated transporter), member 1